MNNRVQWCKDYITFDWTKVVFTDETYIECGGPKSRVWHKNDNFPIRPTVKFPTKLMFWSAISLKKRHDLIVISG